MTNLDEKSSDVIFLDTETTGLTKLGGLQKR